LKWQSYLTNLEDSSSTRNSEASGRGLESHLTVSYKLYSHTNKSILIAENSRLLHIKKHVIQLSKLQHSSWTIQWLLPQRREYMLITWVVTTCPQSNMPINAKKECLNPANSNYFGSNSYSFLLYCGTTIHLTGISHKDKDEHTSPSVSVRVLYFCLDWVFLIHNPTQTCYFKTRQLLSICFICTQARSLTQNILFSKLINLYKWKIK